MPRHRPTTAPKPGFRSVFVETRGLLTAGPESKVWQGEEPSLPKNVEVEGYIVRVVPPADAKDTRIEAVRKFFVALGAAKVFIHARQKTELVAQQHMNREPVASMGPRAAVEALVENSNTEDKELLRKLVQQTMAQEGL